jgi:hypothetical protein
MKATSLQKAIIARGGTAEITRTPFKSLTGRKSIRIQLTGQLNGWDVHMSDEENSYFTMRRVIDRNFCDMGSDYNSGGYDFCHKLNELDWPRYQKQLA